MKPEGTSSLLDPKKRDPFHETQAGGRFARREICLGDRIGNSVVLKDLGVTLGNRQWEVTCHYCEKVQIRSTGQLNHNIRSERQVLCPVCVRDGFAARGLEVSDKRLERVLAGGPIYTAFEVDCICDDVRKALFEEHGLPLHDEDEPIPVWSRGEMAIVGLTIADGFPYSAKSKKAADDGMKDYAATSDKRYWRRKEEDTAARVKASKQSDEIQEALVKAKAQAKAQAEAKEIELRQVAKRWYERDNAEFKDRAKGASKYLKQFASAGGRLEASAIVEGASITDEACPCGSGRNFVDCHGETDHLEEGARASSSHRSVRSSVLAYMMLGSSFHALGSGHRHGSLLRCDKLQVAMNRAWDALPQRVKRSLFGAFSAEARKLDAER